MATERPSVIPWTSSPAKPNPAPDPNAPVTHVVLHRPCAASDLTARADGWGGALGTAYEYLSFTNRSRSACTLSGFPHHVVDVDRAGNRRQIALVLRGYGNGEDAVANLLPGQTGLSQIAQTDACPGFLHLGYVPRFDVELPDGSYATITVPGSHYQAPAPSCPANASWFGTLRVKKPEPRYPQDALTATLSQVPTVHARQAFGFTVALTNPTSKPISLMPCPTYQEIVSTDPLPGNVVNVVRRYFHLNCAGHQDVKPLQSLTFAMRAPAPPRAGQNGQLSWLLQPAALVVSASISVVS